MENKSEKLYCNAKITFIDDRGKQCIFYCELHKGHSGRHSLKGTGLDKDRSKMPYFLEWGSENVLREKMEREEDQAEGRCQFEKDGYCSALACYSPRSCDARDKNGNPKYISWAKGKKLS